MSTENPAAEGSGLGGEEPTPAEKKAAAREASKQLALKVINDPVAKAKRPDTVGRLGELLPTLALNDSHVGGLANMFGGVVDDSRQAMWSQQDDALSREIAEATKIPMPPGVEKNSFIVAPMDVMTHVVQEADGERNVYASPLELNGPGFIGVTSASQYLQNEIWNGTRDISGRALKDIRNPLVLVTISGSIDDPNKMAHEKVATACLIAEGIEQEQGLPAGTVKTYTLHDLQAGIKTLDPNAPAVVLGYTTAATAALELGADRSFSLEGRRVNGFHNDRVLKNLDTLHGNKIDHTSYKALNRTWEAGQGKEVFYAAANDVMNDVRGSFPMADREIKFTAIPIQGEPSAPTPDALRQGFDDLYAEIRNFHAKNMHAILKPSGSGNGIGITMIDRGNFPGQVQEVIDARIATEVKEGIKALVKKGELEKSDRAAVTTATDRLTAELTPRITQQIRAETGSLQPDALAEYVIRAKIGQMWNDVTKAYTNDNGKISAGWPVTVAERYDPCTVNRPGDLLHDHTFEFRFPVYASVDPDTGQVFLKCAPTVGKVNANLGIGVNNTTAGTSGGAPLLGGQLQVPMNAEGLAKLGVNVDQVMQMAQAAVMMASRCCQIHARDQSLSPDITPLEGEYRKIMDQQVAEKLVQKRREKTLTTALGISQAEVAGLNGQVTGLNGRVTNLNGQVAGLNGQVTGLQGQVLAATNNRNNMEAAKNRVLDYLATPPVRYTTEPHLASNKGKKYEFKKVLALLPTVTNDLRFSSTYIPHPDTNQQPINYQIQLTAADRAQLGTLRVVPAPDEEFRVPHDNRIIAVVQDQSVLIRAQLINPDRTTENVALRLSPERINGLGVTDSTGRLVTTQVIRASLQPGGVPLAGFNVPTKALALEHKAAHPAPIPAGGRPGI